jgi:hypothetical protein
MLGAYIIKQKLSICEKCLQTYLSAGKQGVDSLYYYAYISNMSMAITSHYNKGDSQQVQHSATFINLSPHIMTEPVRTRPKKEINAASRCALMCKSYNFRNLIIHNERAYIQFRLIARHRLMHINSVFNISFD